MKEGIWKILGLFYSNKNAPLHLREISRKINLRESGTSRYLNELVKDKILMTIKDGNMKKFYMSIDKIPEIFPLFDNERLERLPLLRRNAVKKYLEASKNKPVVSVIFGSTAKDTFRSDSDIDILEISNTRKNKIGAASYVEAQTGIHIQVFPTKEIKFRKELKIKEDKLIQSAVNTGFPVFNSKYYYEMIYNE